MLDYSTTYAVIRDKYKAFTSDSALAEMQQNLFDTRKYKNMTHSIKFAVWKESISNRVLFEILFLAFMTIIFQIQLS